MKNVVLRVDVEHSIDAESLEIINSVRFTKREIDIIAYLVSGRGGKTTASCLDMAPKTVEAHTRNIMLKLGSNSKEGVINFIEQSDKFLEIKNHYLKLLNKTLFKQQLKKVSLLTEKNNPVCFVTSLYQQENEVLVTQLLKKHLNLAGVNIFEYRNKHKSVTDLIRDLELQRIDKVFYVVSKKSINQPQTRDALDRISQVVDKNNRLSSLVTFLILDKDSNISIPKQICDIGYIDFTTSHNYYFAVFEILKNALSTTNIDEIIKEFEQSYKKTTDEFFGDSHSPSSKNYQQEKQPSVFPLLVKQKNTFRWPLALIKQEKIHLFIGFFLCITSVLSVALMFRGQSEKNSESAGASKAISSAIPLKPKPVRSELRLPDESILLQRPELIRIIESRFNTNRESVTTVALVGVVGMGGVGKTTLARIWGRLYGKKHPNSSIWEINAETPTSLTNSFRKLADSLAQTPQQKEDLSFINQIHNQEEKEKQRLNFIKSCLREQPGWLLIFDNVETYQDIKDYLPQDPTIWGMGHVLITTRNAHIQDAEVVKKDNILEIDKLSSEESVVLFVRNRFQRDPQELPAIEHEKISKFLTKLPPFPLDVSTAAKYLACYDLSYEEYLQEMREQSKEFDSSLESLLKENREYTKTRYGIVALALKRIMEKDERFTDLLVLISLLDSQNIPMELLSCHNTQLIAHRFLNELRKSSLITCETKTCDFLFSVHRSIQDIMGMFFRKTLSTKMRDALIANFALNMKSYYYKNKIDSTKMLLLLRHLIAFEEKNNHIAFVGIESTQMLPVYFCLGNIYATQACHPIQAQKYLSRIEESSMFESFFSNREKADVFTNLANSYSYLCNTDKSRSYAQKSIALLQKISNASLLIAENYRVISDSYRRSNNFQESYKFAIQALESIQKLNDSESKRLLQSEIYTTIATLYTVSFNKEKYKEGLIFIYKALDLLDANKLFHKDTPRQSGKKLNHTTAYARWMLGFLYFFLQQYDLALEEGFLELEYILNHHCTHSMIDRSRMLSGYGASLLRLGRSLEQAEEMLDKAISMRDDIMGKKMTVIERGFQAELKNRLEKYNQAYQACSVILSIKDRERNNLYDISYAQIIYHAGVASLGLMNVQQSLLHFQHFLKEMNSFCKGFLEQDAYQELQKESVFLIDSQKSSLRAIETCLRKSLKIFTAIYGAEHSFVKNYVKPNLDLCKTISQTQKPKETPAFL